MDKWLLTITPLFKTNIIRIIWREQSKERKEGHLENLKVMIMKIMIQIKKLLKRLWNNLNKSWFQRNKVIQQKICLVAPIKFMYNTLEKIWQIAILTIKSWWSYWIKDFGLWQSLKLFIKFHRLSKFWKGSSKKKCYIGNFCLGG